MKNVVILGSGPAGWTAAIYAARANLQPLVIEGLQPGGQLTTTTDIENFPGFPEGLGGFELMDKMKQQAVRFGAEVKPGVVDQVDFTGSPLKVMTDDGTWIEALTVIVATGASAKYLGLESEQKLRGHGVSGCATCDGAFFRNVPVAVVGGGDTAMEEALFLTRFASRVYIVHRRDQFRASPVMAARALKHPKIAPVWNSVVEEVLDVAQNKVTGLRLRDVASGATRVLEVSGMFLGIGHEPNTAPFRGQLELTDKGYIKTTNTRTNVAGVFAAGDVQDATYRQAVTAAGSGCTAALEVGWHLQSLGK